MFGIRASDIITKLIYSSVYHQDNWSIGPYGGGLRDGYVGTEPLRDVLKLDVKNDRE